MPFPITPEGGPMLLVNVSIDLKCLGLTGEECGEILSMLQRFRPGRIFVSHWQSQCEPMETVSFRNDYSSVTDRMAIDRSFVPPIPTISVSDPTLEAAIQKALADDSDDGGPTLTDEMERDP